MEIKLKSTFILLILTVLVSCNKSSDYDFISKWQSLNDSECVIEFTKTQNIILYREGNSFWSQVTNHGELAVIIEKDFGNWYDFKTFDGDEIFFKGRIEVISADRIRIYILKHHNILDVADEYYRTDGFNNWSEIFDAIDEEPDDINK